MQRETTVNIGVDVYARLKRAADAAGISRNMMVSAVITYACRKAKPRAVVRGLVKYQGRSDMTDWRRVHVRFRDDEYEFFHDLRKVWKMSVSFILTEAIENYLDELIPKLIKNPDNYRYQNYASSRIVVDDMVCWVFYWGMPKKLLTGTG